jgi:hypothetical protein
MTNRIKDIYALLAAMALLLAVVLSEEGRALADPGLVAAPAPTAVTGRQDDTCA